MKSRDEPHLQQQQQQHQIFMTTISPLMISHNNFTINTEVQQFHHLYFSTMMCHYSISLLPFAWKQQ